VAPGGPEIVAPEQTKSLPPSTGGDTGDSHEWRFLKE
jgi:hypothetical protein